MSAQLGQLGFWTALISAGASIIGGSKAEKKAKQQAAYQASVDAISSGQAVAAPSVMTPEDINTLRRFWPQIRQANHFALINWKVLGADISAPAKAALAPIWGTVKQAANFSDVNWDLHAVPINKVAAVLPVPELPQYLQPQPIPVSTMQAGMFGAGIPQEYLLAGGVGLALLIILSDRR